VNVDAKGQFTYWSQRTFARPSNKGLRLDYFLCSKDMFRKEEKAETMTLMIKDDDDGRNDVDADVIDKEDTRRTVSVITTTSTIASSQVTSQNDNGDVIATTNTTTTTTLKSPIVYDCYIIHQDTIGVSDHCPVMLVLQL
jgi:exonuclease III